MLGRTADGTISAALWKVQRLSRFSACNGGADSGCSASRRRIADSRQASPSTTATTSVAVVDHESGCHAGICHDTHATCYELPDRDRTLPQSRVSIPVTHVTYFVKERVIPTEKISTDIESRKLRKPTVHGRRLKPSFRDYQEGNYGSREQRER